MRLFVALDSPDRVRASLRELIARLKPESGSARWVRPEGMHVTLKFIGETDSNKVGVIRSAIACVQSAQAVELHFRGLGFFPNEHRPRVLWCAVESSPNLAELAAAVDQALAPLEIPRESRAFVPHLTLARFNASRGPSRGVGKLDKLVRVASELKSSDFGSALETEFYLYESILKPSGAEYKRLAGFPFTGGPHTREAVIREGIVKPIVKLT
jgi:2'-5' RNA ligase